MLAVVAYPLTMPGGPGAEDPARALFPMEEFQIPDSVPAKVQEKVRKECDNFSIATPTVATPKSSMQTVYEEYIFRLDVTHLEIIGKWFPHLVGLLRAHLAHP